MNQFFYFRCFPKRWPLYFGVITPFTIIYTLNVIVFLIVVSIVLRRKDRSENKSNPRKKMRKAFIVFVLALMFGIGWAFGILGSEDRNALSIVFQFLFIIIVGCQGLLIFLLHPCRSKDALNLWKKWFCGVTCMHHDEARKSSIQISRDQPTPQTFALVESSMREEESIVKEESAMKEKFQFSTLPQEPDLPPSQGNALWRERDPSY